MNVECIFKNKINKHPLLCPVKINEIQEVLLKVRKHSREHL